jgi:AcrR family transcriptional regulator
LACRISLQARNHIAVSSDEVPNDYFPTLRRHHTDSMSATSTVADVTSGTAGRCYRRFMPRITEPTVAEHRARQLRNLLDTARAIVATDGPDALTLASLATRVGRSRSSLYEYFSSRDDLVSAMLEDEMPVWADRIAAEVAAAETFDAKIEAFVRAQLELMADGAHRALAALSGHILAEESRDQLRDAHTALTKPLIDTLASAKIANPSTRAALIQGTINTAVTMLQENNRRHNNALIRATAAYILHGVAPADPSPPSRPRR